MSGVNTHIGSKIMMAVACFIIALHSVVPHHDHDDARDGIVFENELGCQCDHHEHERHDGCCRLQDLLSQLVISSKDEKLLCFILTAAICAADFAFEAVDGLSAMTPDGKVRMLYGAGSSVIRCLHSISSIELRGPPFFTNH